MTRNIIATVYTAVALFFSSSYCLSAADEHHNHDHGELISVGEVTYGGAVARVVGAGAPSAGKEWHVALALPAVISAPKAIRMWVGIENGRGSEKAKAEVVQAGIYEAHVDVPAPLIDGSKLWVSIEPTSGETVKVSLPLPVADVNAVGGHDHSHEHHSDHKH